MSSPIALITLNKSKAYHFFNPAILQGLTPFKNQIKHNIINLIFQYIKINYIFISLKNNSLYLKHYCILYNKKYQINCIKVNIN